MLINKKITALFIIFLTVIFLLPDAVFAQGTDVFGINDLAESGVNLGSRDLRDIIAGIVNVFLGFLGVLATLLILYGGFIWMTSNGNADKISRAKRIIINGVVGLMIIVSSYAIARFILQKGYDGIFGNGQGNQGQGYFGGAGLGAGALESHYPARNAQDVARNTNIYLTFKEPIRLSEVVVNQACGGVNCEANSGFINLWEQGNATPITGNDLVISYTDNGSGGAMTFKIDPYGANNVNLGSNTADVNYRMELGDLTTLNGSPAFPYGNSYSWIFTTGTEFDFTPPTVVSVVPVDLGHPRNTIVQINFSEAVNPILASGDTANGFSNISVTDNVSASLVNGEYKISNQYRTVELITTDLCGQNSCGGDVYCLPVSLDFTGLVTDSVADMADNLLDGDEDGNAGGNYSWNFGTTDQIDLTPPNISHMDDPNDISLSDPIEVEFDKNLMSSSINSSNIDIAGQNGAINYWLSLVNGQTLRINHDKLDPSSYYYPRMTSGIKDLRQNCWYPCACDAADASCVCTNNTIGTDCPGTNCAAN